MRRQTRHNCVHAVFHVEGAAPAARAFAMAAVPWLASEVTRAEAVTVAEVLEVLLMARYVAMVVAMMVAIGLVATAEATRRR